MNQRWHNRRNSFRPHDPIDTSKYEVARIDNDTAAKEFILQHHYSGSYPAARFRFGLYTAGKLVGVAVYSHPVNNKTLTNVFGGDALESVELGRFVLLDSVPGNGETWFLAQCFRRLRSEGLRGVLSFSDPVPRSTTAGRVVFPGHIGVIYQAHNAVYLGRGTARALKILPDGTVFSDRAIQKIRKREQGWQYSMEHLVRFGAPRLIDGDPDEWLQAWLPRLCRQLKHPGNFKYAWSFSKAIQLAPADAYPKRKAA